MFDEYAKQAQAKMKGNVEAFRARVRKIRTGRASPALLESVHVIYYGSSTPLLQMANISTPSPRQLVVTPWDLKALKDIQQALTKANIGANPQIDEKIIRLTLPELTEERRKELVKEVKKMAEKCRVDLRNSRRSVNEEIKKAQKEKVLSEDDQKLLIDKIQKVTDDFIKQVEQIVQSKEKEILEF